MLNRAQTIGWLFPTSVVVIALALLAACAPTAPTATPACGASCVTETATLRPTTIIQVSPPSPNPSPTLPPYPGSSPTPCNATSCTPTPTLLPPASATWTPTPQPPSPTTTFTPAPTRRATATATLVEITDTPRPPDATETAGPTDTPLPPTETGTPTSTPDLEGPFTGWILIDNGAYMTGGVAGTPLELSVTYGATSSAGPVTEMRTRRVGVCPPDSLESEPWGNFEAIRIDTFTVIINFVTYSYAVQYRDVAGRISPIYCATIIVEGMPGPSP